MPPQRRKRAEFVEDSKSNSKRLRMHNRFPKVTSTPVMPRTGQITSSGEGVLEWNMGDFEISLGNLFRVWSPLFLFSGHEYQIQLLKMGNASCIETTFSRFDRLPLPNLCFEFHLRDEDGRVSPSYSVTADETTSYYVYGDMRLDKLGRFRQLTLSLRMRTHHAKSQSSCAIQTEVADAVSRAVQTEVADKVRCAIQAVLPDSVNDKETPKDGALSPLDDTKGITLLSDRMKDLLINGTDHDVKIFVKNKEFRAHRIILSARSPVFAMMLKHDTEENQTGTIKIEDCDPDSFDEFLLYVYSGRTQNLAVGKALQLYYSADKYDFPELKAHCVSFLGRSLCVTSICDVILLATKHGEKELLEVATEFFARNMKEILVSVGWQNFLIQNPTEANELYIKSMDILLPRK